MGVQRCGSGEEQERDTLRRPPVVAVDQLEYDGMFIVSLGVGIRPPAYWSAILAPITRFPYFGWSLRPIPLVLVNGFQVDSTL